MKCLRKYKWVKLPRAVTGTGKGLMGSWIRLASSAAFRSGTGYYCGHSNPVEPGMWSGGIVGIKSILGVRSREKAMQILEQLEELGYLSVTYDRRTRQITYRISDWPVQCPGQPTDRGTVYASEGYGFLCVPRTVTERMLSRNQAMEESDAWLDLWCHTVYRDYGNAFSFLAPAVQFGKYGSVVSLEGLGRRWGWEKTKVWRFFRKHSRVFHLSRLPGSYGCLIFNLAYPAGNPVPAPPDEAVRTVMHALLALRKDSAPLPKNIRGLNALVAWKSRQICTEKEAAAEAAQNGVALLHGHIRAYFSHGWNCKHCWNSSYDCQGAFFRNITEHLFYKRIRGPCKPGTDVPLIKLEKEILSWKIRKTSRKSSRNCPARIGWTKKSGTWYRLWCAGEWYRICASPMNGSGKPGRNMPEASSGTPR